MKSHKKGYYVLFDYLGLTFVLVALVVVFGLSTDHFLTFKNFQTIANQVPDAIVIAVGMTYVLIIAGIDLSVGSILAVAGAVLGISLVRFDLSLSQAILACLATGAVCGLLNGLVVIRWSLPSFIVTLGMMEIARGAAYLLTNSQTQYIGGDIEPVSEAAVFGFSIPFLIAISVVVVGQAILSFTVFGRHMFAVGANEQAALLSGIKTLRVKVWVFVICGVLSSLAAVIYCARLAAADPNAGLGYELQAIAAVVIGGTSLMGGRGSVVNSFIGVLIIAVLEHGLAQVGAQEPTKRLVTGCVIVVAVIIDFYRNRLGNR